MWFFIQVDLQGWQGGAYNIRAQDVSKIKEGNWLGLGHRVRTCIRSVFLFRVSEFKRLSFLKENARGSSLQLWSVEFLRIFIGYWIQENKSWQRKKKNHIFHHNFIRQQRLSVLKDLSAVQVLFTAEKSPTLGVHFFFTHHSHPKKFLCRTFSLRRLESFLLV